MGVYEHVNETPGTEFTPIGGDVSEALQSGTDGLTARLSLDQRRALRTTALSEQCYDFTSGACSATTGWTVLGNDTVNLAATTLHITGTGAIEFDKANGEADTKNAGVYRTLSSVSLAAYDIHDEIGMTIYMSDLTDVDYAFIRIGTNSTTYNEYRYPRANLVEGSFSTVQKAILDFDDQSNAGANLSDIDYLAAGVTFLVETDTLADITIDEIYAAPNGGHRLHEYSSLVVDGTSYQGEEGTVISPDTDVSTTPVALAIPKDAKFAYLRGTAAIRYGSNATLDGTTDEGYDYCPAYESTPPIPVLDGTALYYRINATSGTCTVYHHFDKRTK